MYFVIFFGCMSVRDIISPLKVKKWAISKCICLRVKFKLFSLLQQTYFEFSKKIISPRPNSAVSTGWTVL